MTHASVELVEAMAGVAPRLVADANGPVCDPVCGAWGPDVTQNYTIPAFGWGSRGIGAIPTRADAVTCPRCQVAMDAAREGRVLTP